MKFTAIKFGRSPADILKRMPQVTSFFDLRTFSIAFLVPFLLCSVGATVIFFLASDELSTKESGFPVEISGAPIGFLDIKVEDTHIDAAPLKPDETASPAEHGGHAAAETITEEPLPTVVAQPTDKPDGLFEQTPFGDVPIIRQSDKASVSSVYKMPFVPDVSAKGIISVVLLNYGLSDRVTASLLSKTPKEVTFVVSPYASELQNKIDLARTSGHEVWIQAIIQGANFGTDDTGPLTMLSGLNTTQNNIRLLQTLSLGHGYAGVVFENDPDFKDSPSGLQDIMAFLGSHGLALSTASSSTMVSDLGRSMNVNYVPASLLISSDMTEAGVRKSLEAAQTLANKNYFAVVYAYPTAATLSVLKTWPDELKASAIQLAPLSVVHDKFSHTSSAVSHDGE